MLSLSMHLRRWKIDIETPDIHSFTLKDDHDNRVAFHAESLEQYLALRQLFKKRDSYSVWQNDHHVYDPEASKVVDAQIEQQLAKIREAVVPMPCPPDKDLPF